MRKITAAFSLALFAALTTAGVRSVNAGEEDAIAKLEAKAAEAARRTVSDGESANEIRMIEFLTIGMIMSEALKMPVDRQNRADEMRVANHLAKRGWERAKRRISKGSPPLWCWKRPEVKS